MPGILLGDPIHFRQQLTAEAMVDATKCENVSSGPRRRRFLSATR
jgi:hypothetical protein